jgi:hypothetical protein
MLLVDGFNRPTTQRPKLQDIQNLQTGAIVPADMTVTVCKQKIPVSIASSKDLSGWGISFGNYETAKNADMALRGRLLSSSGMDLPGEPGIIRMPGSGGYAAVMWNLDQQNSLAACTGYRAQKAPCEVLSPETFAQIAALTPEPPPKPVADTDEGSDGKTIKKKSKKTRKKKKK